MIRLLVYVALLILTVLAVKRLLPPGKPGRRERPRRPPRGEPSPDTVICAACGTRYSPSREGWTCPGCGK